MPAPNILSWQPIGQLDLSDFNEWTHAPPRYVQMSDGSIVRAQVVVSEDGDDDLIITEHPVEQGAVINDHAFKRPAELRVQMGWSNAFAEMSGLDGSGGVSLNAIYDTILALQATRLPFTVYTGRRVYYNMLVASLRTHTDAKLEFTFMADITFKEIVLVNTSVTVVPDATTYNSSNLADPASNSATLQTGTLNTVPKTIPYNPPSAA